MLKAIKEDLESLNGKEVTIFGQSCKLEYDDSDCLVKASNICDELMDLECDDTESDEVFNAYDNGCDYKVLNTLNSYNYNGCIDHDIQIIAIEYNGKQYALVSFHRYGDARCNYTSVAVLKDEYSKDLFLDLLYRLDEVQAYTVKTIDGKDYFITASATSEVINVWCNQDQSEFNIYCLDDLEDKIKELNND